VTTVKPVYRGHSREHEAVDIYGQLTFIYNINWCALFSNDGKWDCDVLYRVDKLGSILIAFFSPIQFCNDLPDICHYTDYNTKIRIVFFSQFTKIGIHEFKWLHRA